jgi:L-arabinose isomerase
MKPLGEFERWFVTGSQEMSGESVLRRVDDDARQVASALEAASSSIGVAAWMHTFSAELDMDFMLRPASAWCAHTSAP